MGVKINISGSEISGNSRVLNGIKANSKSDIEVNVKKSEIVENGKIKKTWRGQISTFGAAVTMGSLIPAVAFFSDQGGSSVKRQCIMDAILEILKRDHIAPEKYHTLFEYVREQGEHCREDVLNAAIALKLAMNLYTLEKE